MLAKRIDLGSKPLGLWIAETDLVKGRLVKLENDKVVYATKDDEAMGFCTLRIDTVEGGEIQDHDTIEKGKRPVIYTLDKHDVWLTTECDGIDALKIGDKLTCGAEGKLAKGEGMFEVVEITKAADVPAVGVRVLK